MSTPPELEGLIDSDQLMRWRNQMRMFLSAETEEEARAWLEVLVAEHLTGPQVARILDAQIRLGAVRPELREEALSTVMGCSFEAALEPFAKAAKLTGERYKRTQFGPLYTETYRKVREMYGQGWGW